VLYSIRIKTPNTLDVFSGAGAEWVISPPID
jgi:hypothetical protein